MTILKTLMESKLLTHIPISCYFLSCLLPILGQARDINIFINEIVGTRLERIYKPHYDYQTFSPLANGTDLDRQKYAILQTHWH